MSNYLVIKCDGCGAPMYSHQEGESYRCMNCSKEIPWQSRNEGFEPKIRYRHRFIPEVDGLLKLTHVGTHRAPPVTYDEDDLSKRLTRRWLDGESGTPPRVEMDCPHCGAIMSGKRDQSFMRCDFCGNMLMHERSFTYGEFSADSLIGYTPGLGFLPGKAIAFSFNRKKAIHLIGDLARKYPFYFGDLDVLNNYLEAKLETLYLPFGLADISVRANLNTEKGYIDLYQERINWPWPDNTQFDVFLMDALEPWCFEALSDYNPAYLEGDVKVIAPVNSGDRGKTVEQILWRAMKHGAKNALSVKKSLMTSWSTNTRMHGDGSVMLPIYYVEWGKYLKNIAKIAVNGQTGKVVAVFLKSNGDEVTLSQDGDASEQMKGEYTIVSPLMQVKYVKSPFLYEVIRSVKS